MKKEQIGQKIRNNFLSLRARRPSLVGLLMGIALLAAGPATQAASLDLTLQNTPDILVQGMTVSYDAGPQQLSAFGTAVQIDVPGIETIAGGVFNLIATVDNAGSLAGGSVDITGTVANLGWISGSLLTGNLTQFGFNPAGGDPLEFVFDITGGDAAASFLAVMPVGGIVMTLTDFPGDFSADWSSQAFVAVADVAPVPVPAAAWLFGSALLGLAGVARRRAA